MPESLDANERYSRQRLLPEIGAAGQRKLAESRVVVVGCGALGTVQAALLVRAGVGETVLIDRDYVEASNLPRQCLFEEEDAERGTPKAVAAARSLRRANSAVSVVASVKDLTATNAESLLRPAGVILDGTDNYETRYLINDVAVKWAIPWVYGAGVGTRGSVMAVVPGSTACLRCIFPAAPGSLQPTCDTTGVLNAATSLIASLQVVEAFKILTGCEESLDRRLVSCNVWTGERSSIRVDLPDPNCPCCGQGKFQYLEAQAASSARICGRDAVQVQGGGRPVDLADLARKLAPHGGVRSGEHAVRFSCPPHELMIFPDGRAIVRGTQEVGVARSLYARYVGD